LNALVLPLPLLPPPTAMCSPLRLSSSSPLLCLHPLYLTIPFVDLQLSLDNYFLSTIAHSVWSLPFAAA